MRWLLLSVVVVCACARSTVPDGPHQASFDRPHDEVFDAARLTLLELGDVVDDAQRVRGTLAATRVDGSHFSVSVEPHASTELVTVTDDSPAHFVRFEDRVQALLDTWRTVPEWTFDARRNALLAPRFSMQPPHEWQHVDFALERHEVVVQRTSPRPGLNSTLVVTWERRRFDQSLPVVVRHAASRALSAGERLLVQDDLDAPLTNLGRTGTTDLLDGNVTIPVSFKVWEMRDDAWTVRLVMVCAPEGEDACDSEWPAVVRSVVGSGFTLAR